MRKSIEFSVIKVIAYIVLCMNLITMKDISAFLCILVVSLLIINNNLRAFYFTSDISINISLVLEIIVGGTLSFIWGGYVVFFLIGAIIDIFTLKKKKLYSIYLSLILLIVVVFVYKSSYIQIISTILLFLILYILLSYIQKLYFSKEASEKLYDKLRISEDKLKEANKELENYSHSIEELTLLKERNRISRDIHDSVGHALTTAIIQLSAMEALGEKQSPVLKEMAGNLREFISDSFQDVKRAVNELKPDEYENYQGILRLQDACKNFEKLSGVKVNIRISKEQWSLSTKQLQNLYRITQECLSNSLRHGKATEVNVVMSFTNNDFVLSFKDNGVGTSVIEEKGIGLKSIKERALEINGFVQMKSKKNEGFFVKITVPREKEI